MKSKQNKENRTPPNKVFIAVTLLWLLFATSVISSIFNFSSTLEKVNASGVDLGRLIFTLCFTLFFLAFLIWKIGRGRNWARITYLILFIIGVPMTIYGYFILSTSSFSIIQGIVGAIVNLLALILLFQKESSEWFRLIKTK